MPNDCDNRLTITPPAADYEKLKALLTNDDGELTFTKAVPRPDSEYWYEWNNENWGTKWDAYDGSPDSGTDGQIRFFFTTAWSPAVLFVERLSALFPDSTFVLEYLEASMGFGGEVTCVSGVITKDVEEEDDELLGRKLSMGWGVDDIVDDLDDEPNALLNLLAHDAVPVEFLTALMELSDEMPLSDAALAAIMKHPNYPRAVA